jgi:hypothetical protein
MWPLLHFSGNFLRVFAWLVVDGTPDIQFKNHRVRIAEQPVKFRQSNICPVHLRNRSRTNSRGFKHSYSLEQKFRKSHRISRIREIGRGPTLTASSIRIHLSKKSENLTTSHASGKSVVIRLPIHPVFIFTHAKNPKISPPPSHPRNRSRTNSRGFKHSYSLEQKIRKSHRISRIREIGRGW